MSAPSHRYGTAPPRFSHTFRPSLNPVKDDDTDAHVKTLLHEHRIGKLEDSDKSQWSKIHNHSDWFHEIHITMKLVKIGIGFLSVFGLAVVVWVRGGWEALAALIIGR
jgi:hypothetical protein